MEDSSLDNFFAKKDKKKSKTTKKYVRPDDYEKMLEDSVKGVVVDSQARKKEKEKSTLSSVGGNSKILDQNDDEWRVVDSEVDYTGLRVQALNIQQQEQEEREIQMQENGQDKKDDVTGPWKVSKSSDAGDASAEESQDEVSKPNSEPGEQQQTQQQQPQQHPVQQQQEPAPKAEAQKTSYVPPHLRNLPAGASQTSSSGIPTRLTKGVLGRRSKHAPEISNEDEFPSLGGPGEGAVNTKDFTSVKHGARDLKVSSGAAALNLANRYQSLTGSSQTMDEYDK